MIKTSETQDFSINVKLKNGELFENKDITSSPTGEHERGANLFGCN